MNPTKEKLVTDNIRFSTYMAKRFLSTGIEWDELVSLCNLGLVKAAHAYNPGRGYKFATLAATAMKNEVLMELRRKKHPTVPLDEVIADDGAGGQFTRADILSCEEAGYADVEFSLELAGMNLTQKQRMAIRLMNAGYSQKEIGGALGYSQSYVSRIARSVGRKILRRSDL